MSADANLIARVLEGRATAEERASLLAQADESPELLALLADSAAAMNESQAAPSRIAPIEPRRAHRMPVAVWGAIAAGIVVAVALPALRGTGVGVPAVPFGSMSLPQSGIQAARSGPALPSVRGSGSSSRSAQSALLGARVADYMILAKGADTSATTVAIEIAAALREIAGGSAAAAQVEGLGSGPLTAEIVGSIELVVDSAVFRAAEWAELVRIAASQRSEDVIRDAQLQAAVNASATDRALRPDSRAAASRLASALALTPHDWGAIDKASVDLLVALARR